jgi:aspartyl/asparaginyl beta-hydroxylase (cupin superfamily)
VENCAQFPNTFDLLKELNIPLAVRGVCFARQTPGSGVAPHSDGRNFILTSHLGLKIPEGKAYYATYFFHTYQRTHMNIIDRMLDQSRGRRTNLERGEINDAGYFF